MLKYTCVFTNNFTWREFYMDTDDVKNKAEDALESATEDACEAAEDVSTKMLKNGKDWVNYIQNHPLQAVFFGLIGYFALKGILKR
jgi:hypothetical protein